MDTAGGGGLVADGGGRPLRGEDEPPATDDDDDHTNNKFSVIVKVSSVDRIRNLLKAFMTKPPSSQQATPPASETEGEIKKDENTENGEAGTTKKGEDATQTAQAPNLDAVCLQNYF